MAGIPWLPVAESLKLSRPVLDDADLRELYGVATLPLAVTSMSIVIGGVPVEVVNGIRREILDGITGKSLELVLFETDDPFLRTFEEVVRSNIRCLPVRWTGAPAGRYALEAFNGTVSPITIYSGSFDFPAAEPFVNPSFHVATLAPGRHLKMEVAPTEGVGRVDARYSVGARAALTHLDLQTTDDKPDESGYVESSLVAAPRKHRLSFDVPSTLREVEACEVFEAACVVIAKRFEPVIATAANEGGDAGEASGIDITHTDVGDGLHELVVRLEGDTDTLGAMISRAAYDLDPDVSVAMYNFVATDNRLHIMIRSADPLLLFSRALSMCLKTIESLRAAVEAMAKKWQAA